MKSTSFTGLAGWALLSVGGCEPKPPPPSMVAPTAHPVVVVTHVGCEGGSRVFRAVVDVPLSPRRHDDVVISEVRSGAVELTGGDLEAFSCADLGEDLGGCAPRQAAACPKDAGSLVLERLRTAVQDLTPRALRLGATAVSEVVCVVRTDGPASLFCQGVATRSSD